MEGALFLGLKLLIALFLVALNALFVAAEFAFTKMRSTQVESMVQEGKTSANLVREGTQNLDAYLAVCQVGITIASLGLGALGEPAVANLLRPVLGAFLPEGLIHTIAFAAAFGIITFLHVTYGELASKSVAIAKPEGTSQLVAPFMKFFYYLFYPLTVFFNGVANRSVSLFGVPPASETEEGQSEEELHMLVGQSRRQGYLEHREASRVRAALELDEKMAREIMVPRTEVVALPTTTGLNELASVAAEGNQVRYPLFEDGCAERIVGTVHTKDILRAAKAHGSLEADVTAADIMHDILTVPESRRVDEVLNDLQENRLQMAVVIDEWGSFEGLITVEDILEEIVGEIRDEWEEESGPAVRRLEDGTYVMRGTVPIREVNEALDANFESEAYSTIGGVVLEALGRLPEVGDEVFINGYVLCVNEVDGPRVARVTAYRDQQRTERGEG